MSLERNVVHHADCLSRLEFIEPESVDAIITSPPFFAPPYHGQEGLGSRPDEYVSHLLLRLKVAASTLKHSGVLFLHLSDGYEPLRLPWRVVDALCERLHFRGQVICAQPRRKRSYDTLFVLSKREGFPLTNDIWTFTEDDALDDLAFPEQLVHRCLDQMDLLQGVVLDPFMGAGTTAVVALKRGWEFLGFEKDEQRCRTANARVLGVR